MGNSDAETEGSVGDRTQEAEEITKAGKTQRQRQNLDSVARWVTHSTPPLSSLIHLVKTNPA